jgi:NTP-dependent ternary conflict system VMAP-like protein/effector-associated domain 2 (EAD2)-containing protein
MTDHFSFTVVPLVPVQGYGEDDAAGSMTEHLRQNLQVAVVNALLKTGLTGSGAQHLLVEMLQERLGRELTLPEQPTERLRCIELVRACTETESGMTELSAVVGQMEPGASSTAELHRLADEWDALTAVPDLEATWVRLRQAVQTVPRPGLTGRISDITDSRLGTLPHHCTTTWSVFIRVVGQNAMPGALPPWMILLDRLTEEMSSETARYVRAQLRRWARQWDLAELLDKSRADSGSHSVSTQRVGFVMIQIAPDSVDPDRYTLSFWHQWDAEGAVASRGDDRIVYRAGLETAVEQVVAQVEQDWSDHPSELRIEFFLPLSLLNEAFEWWSKDSSFPPAAPLALYHSVVVRSLERLRRPAWHRVWRSRWEQLQQQPAASRVLWVDPRRADHVRRLEADLTSDPGYVAVVLSEPPRGDPSEPQEVMIALRSGVPVIIWHRIDSTTPAFRNAVSELIADGGLARLPSRAAQLRRTIEGLETGPREDHAARHVTILWDDAHRTPELPRVSMS